MKAKTIDPTKLTFEMLDAFLSQPNTSAGIVAAIEAAPAVDLDLTAEIVRLDRLTDQALEAAFKSDDAGKWAVNWGGVSCVKAEKYIDQTGANGYRVWIEEAESEQLAAFVTLWLHLSGFSDVEVITEW